MTTPAPNAAERARRTEYLRETRAALQNNERLDQRIRKFEDKATAWTHWFKEKMGHAGCADPAKILPDAFARLEQIAEDRVAAATREIKAGHSKGYDMSSFDPLRVRQHDPLQKYRDQAERQEKEFERQRKREERDERRATMANEKAARQQLEMRVAELEASHRELTGQVAEITRAAAEGIDVLAQTRDDLERELKATIAKMEKAIARIRDRGEEEARKTFAFAREKISEVTDLPSFLPPGRDIN
jgi:hypothetical protein